VLLVVRDEGHGLTSALREWLQPWGPVDLTAVAAKDGGQAADAPIADAAVRAAADGARLLVVTAGNPWLDEVASALLRARSSPACTFTLIVLEQPAPGTWRSPAETPLDRLEAIMRRLLAPGGCPWDREQTHRTLRQYVVEEAAEVLESIERDDPEKLADELGDLLLQISFHAALAAEAGQFGLADVAAAIERKMLYRHPHVFAGWKVNGAEDVVHNWDLLKATEQNAAGDIGEQGPWRLLRKNAVRLSLAALTGAFCAARGDQAGHELAWRELECELASLQAALEKALAKG
jgi:NTP pyrophosphatase (non-canonical NTP hydrolase)